MLIAFRFSPGHRAIVADRDSVSCSGQLSTRDRRTSLRPHRQPRHRFNREAGVSEAPLRRLHAGLDLPSPRFSLIRFARLLARELVSVPPRLPGKSSRASGTSCWFATAAPGDTGESVADIGGKREGCWFALGADTALLFDDGYFNEGHGKREVEQVGYDAANARKTAGLRYLMALDGPCHELLPRKWTLGHRHHSPVLVSGWPETRRPGWLCCFRWQAVHYCRAISCSQIERQEHPVGRDFGQAHLGVWRATFVSECPRASLWKHGMPPLPAWQLQVARGVRPTLHRQDAAGVSE